MQIINDERVNKLKGKALATLIAHAYGYAIHRLARSI